MNGTKGEEGYLDMLDGGDDAAAMSVGAGVMRTLGFSEDDIETLLGTGTSKAWDESKHPRHPAGTEQGGEFAPNLSVPDEPGTAPIPEGKVRRFHYTRSDSVEQIRREGLKEAHSTGVMNREPVAIWSTPEMPKTEQPVVEFWDDPEHYDIHPYARHGDITPDRIVAIHKPWHRTYRYVMQNDVPVEDLRSLGNDRLNGETGPRGLTYNDLADIVQRVRARKRFVEEDE